MKKMKGGYIPLKDLLAIWLVLLFYFLLGIIITNVLAPIFQIIIFFVEHINEYLIIIFIILHNMYANITSASSGIISIINVPFVFE